VFFTINRKIIGVVFLAFSFLYMSLEQHRARYFVYISIATNIIYPLLRMQKQPHITLRKILLEGTAITSLLYDVWTLFYPHKVFIYYIPQLVGAVGKIYHILTYDQGNEQEVVEELIKFQSKTEAMVVIYSLATFVLRLKYSWWKLLKLLLLLSIIRLKYSLHYGTRISIREMHFTIDHYSKYVSLRQYYQLLSLKLSRSVSQGGPERQEGDIIF
jgi:hypothetical protein